MFKPIKSEKVYEQVIDQIKGMIGDGTLKKGDKLLSERELAEQFSVSRASVREALRALQVIGLIECRQGEGNFIRESFEEGLFQPLSIMFMLEESSPLEILETRRIIEVETAALAAKKITDEEIRELEKLIEGLDDAVNEDEKARVDKRFHYKIAQASHNLIILNILNNISSLMDVFIKDARNKILANQNNKELIIYQHQNICSALKEGDPGKAANAMRTHLKFIEDYVK